VHIDKGEVVFMSDFYHDTDSCRASRVMFEMAGVRLRKHIPELPRLQINLTQTDMLQAMKNDAANAVAKGQS
jgi:hypothetical protein